MEQRDLAPSAPETGDVSGEVAWSDAKIAYVAERCRGKRVLDLGCVMHHSSAVASRYHLHRALAPVAARLKGLDLLSDGVSAMQARGYDVVQGDAENFDLGETFDVIVAGDIIEHLGNLEGFLTSCRRHLEPDGMIIVQTPNPWYWRHVVKAALLPEVPNNPEHTCWFDPRTLRQLVARFGMDLASVEYQSRYARDRFMPLPRGWKHTSWSAEIRLAEGARR